MNRLLELSNGRFSVLIADADLMSAQLLAAELARGRQDISIAGVSSGSAETIRELEERQPDVALINTHLQDGQMTGYRVLQSLPKTCPKTAAIMMIPVCDRDLVIDAFRGGARGIFCRVHSLKLLSKCVRTVHRGQIWANNLREWTRQKIPLAPPRNASMTRSRSQTGIIMIAAVFGQVFGRLCKTR